MLDDHWLADQLISKGLVTRSQVNEAKDRNSGDLCRDLLSKGAITEADLLKFLGLHFQTRYVSTEKLGSAKIPQWVLELLPKGFCEKKMVLPVRCDKSKKVLSIVTPDPGDGVLMNEVKAKAKVNEVRAYVSLPYAIEAGIRKFYSGDLHAFARMDQALRQDYSEMLNIYEQRLIDFETDAEAQEDKPVEEKPATPPITGEAPAVMPTATPSPPPTTPSPPQTGTQMAIPSSPPPTTPQATIPSPPPGSSSQLFPPTPSQPATPPSQVVPMPPMPPMPPAAPAGAIGQDTWAGVLEVMVSLIEQALGWRANHSATVSQLVWQSAAQAGLQGSDAFNVRLAALLHEIGKPFDRHLTLLSINVLQDHRAAASAAYHEPVRLFSHTSPPDEVLKILGAMYERFDGAGIPGTMSGQQIPVGARLLAVVDAYCDMIANPAAPGGHCPNHQLAVQRLTEAASRGLLDPQMVNIMAHLPTTIQETGRQTGDRPLILVVDEDVRSAAVLEGKLKASGFDAVVVGTPGDAALSLLGENVSLVLSEVELKPMDGFNFLEWLRSNERTSKIPFMFISARAGAEDVNRGFELGALDYIVKPFRPEVVVAKIKRILGL